MHCDIRLRVSVTCTFTIKHGTHVPVVTCAVVTYTTDCKGVRGSVDRVSDSRFKGRRFESRCRQILFLFIEKFTEYFQIFIYILARLSLCVICICQVNACISEFDLLLSTYSKWLYNDQFPPYVVYMYLAHFHITHFPNLIILIVTKFMLTVSQQILNHASCEDLTVIFHINPMGIYPFA